MLSKTFREPGGALPNVLALSVVLIGWPVGIALLGAPAWWMNAAGFALVVWSLTWSAYFIHEFAHLAIFRAAASNERWGAVMSWINGACVARFADLRRKHMRHHVERADVLTFDVRGFLLTAPRGLRGTVLALEWAYVPAVEFVMRGYVVARPFLRRDRRAERPRVIATVLVRLAGWTALGLWSLKALLLYALAYLVFVTLLRFADCFQHTYDAYPMDSEQGLPDADKRDRAYEQANTYSNVVGLDRPLLNLLWLNFGYHNAHHERPVMAWHRLPADHRALYGEDKGQVIPMRQLLKSFHQHRVRRVLADDYGAMLPAGSPGRADGFLGAVGVSFLTAV